MRIQLFFIFTFCFFNISYSQSKNNFRVYDAVMIEDKPDLYKFGFSKINVIYEDSLLIVNNKFPKNPNKRLFSETKFKKTEKLIDSRYPICVDIERWTLYPKDLNENIPKFHNVTYKFKKKYPKVDFGYYGVLPFADLYIYDLVSKLKKDKHGRSWLNQKGDDWWGDWNYLNNRLISISRNNEIAFPSCYTRFKDKDVWLEATKIQINKIKELNPKIKIYAFVWPQYYAKGTTADEKYIERDFWEFQLETLYKLCDGIVIWMPPFNSSNRSTINWDSNSDWLNSTKSFIKKYNIKSNFKG